MFASSVERSSLRNINGIHAQPGAIGAHVGLPRIANFRLASRSFVCASASDQQLGVRMVRPEEWAGATDRETTVRLTSGRG